MKYIFDLSAGSRDILDGDTVLNVLNKLALTPGGGSKVVMRDTLKRFTGTLGLISMVKNSLKPE
jgi:hypothetical protein